MSNLGRFFLFPPPGAQACPSSFICLNVSKCHHLGQRQSQSMGTDCPLEVFLTAELLDHTSSSPDHSLESCFLNCPARTPARSQLATNRTVVAPFLILHPPTTVPAFCSSDLKAPSQIPCRERVIHSCNFQGVSLGLPCSVMWVSVKKTKSQAPT